ncbi:MAG TPA: hypothetical protein VII69_07785 [Candidatus Eremiobacteraceae bacterium]
MRRRDDACLATPDLLYQLAMRHICDLRSDAVRGREFRRARAAGQSVR